MTAPVKRGLSCRIIRTDGGTQPRRGLDNDVVEQYAERLEAGDEFPPVDVFYDGEAYWLAGGFHRLASHVKLGRDAIDAIVHAGSREDAVWFSCAENRQHGLPRTNADKRRAVEMALRARPTMSDRAIAEHVGVSHTMVAGARATTGNDGQSRPEKRTGRDGRTVATGSEKRSVAARERAAAKPRDEVAPPSPAPALPPALPPAPVDRANPSESVKPTFVCATCGEPTQSHLVHCPRCGKHVSSARLGCTDCGADLRGVEAPRQAPSAPRDVMAVLADPASVVDGLGQLIPPALVPLFELARKHLVEVRAHLHAAARAREEFDKGLVELRGAGKLPPGDVTFPLDLPSVAELRELARRAGDSLPYTACTYCGGKDPNCSACRGAWWTTRHGYNRALPENKTVARRRGAAA